MKRKWNLEVEEIVSARLVKVNVSRQFHVIALVAVIEKGIRRVFLRLLRILHVPHFSESSEQKLLRSSNDGRI